MSKKFYGSVKMPSASSETDSNCSDIECEDCGFAFVHTKNVYPQMGNARDCKVKFNHTNSEKGSVLCPVCGKLFTRKAALTKQRKNMIYIEGKSRTCRIKCTECGDENISSYRMLRRHLKIEHDKEIDCEYLSFKSNTEFQKWKSSYQKKHCVSYVLESSEKHLSNSKKQYYHCHRFHTYKRSASDHKSCNTIGTSKIDAACPSTIEMLITDDGYNVTFFSTHMGHEECAQMTTNANENVKLAGVLDKIARRRWQSFTKDLEHSTEETELYSEFQEQIRQKCELIAELNQMVEITKESRDKVCSYLDKIIDELIGASRFSNSEAIPLSQSVYKRTKFIKRKKKPKLAQIEHPNLKIQRIKESFNQLDSKVITIDSSSDHLYVS